MVIRPSNLDRRAACPGSGRMEEDLPDENTQEANEGIDLHWFQAHPNAERSVLKPQWQDLLKIADQLDQQLFDTVIQNEKLLDSDQYVEAREVELEVENLKLVGHIDLLRQYPKRNVTIIRDSKFGYNPVERAEMNMQLRGYAIMSPDEVVYVAITQPRAPFDQRITVARYTHEDIAVSHLQIAAIMLACQDEKAPLHAGDWCRYCRARAMCPELAKAVRQGLVPFDDIPPELELSKAARLERVEARLAATSDQELSEMLKAYSLIQFIYDPMMEEARRRIRDGKMEGWKVSKPTERRKIVDSRSAIALLSLAGMKREDIMECASLSMTKLEAKLIESRLTRHDLVIRSAKDAKTFTNRVLSSIIETEIGKPRVLRK